MNTTTPDHFNFKNLIMPPGDDATKKRRHVYMYTHIYIYIYINTYVYIYINK